MDIQLIITLIGTFAATLGGKEAWSYYKKRLDIKSKMKNGAAAGENKLRDEIKDMLEGRIKECKGELALVQEKVKTLQINREQDIQKIAEQGAKIEILTERLSKHAFKSRGRNREE